MYVFCEHYEWLGSASVDDQFDGRACKAESEKSMVKCLVYRRIRFLIGRLVLQIL